jgi:O-antigen/teichoic acid export membrane protein
MTTDALATDPAPPGDEPPQPRPSLKNVALRGAAWTVVGFGLAQGFRFASNLVLTRLLAPDVFGLMTLVNVLLQALNLFTDIGIGPSIIQNQRGAEPRFLNTAWTLQVLRGGAIAGVCVLLAPLFSWIYRDPQLLPMLLACSLNPLISGLSSIHLHTYNKQLRIGHLTAVNLASQLVTIALTIALALAWRNVWSLVLGTIIGSAARTAWSHALFRGPAHRLMIDRSCLGDMFRFGRWVTVSTWFGFLANLGDRLVLGTVLTKTELGVYSIGYLIPQTIASLTSTLGQRVMFPLFVKMSAQGPEAFRARFLRIKGLLLLGLLPPLWLLILFAQSIIDLCFDPRYRDAGWILRLCATGTVVAPIVGMSATSLLMARGDSFRAMLTTGGHLASTALAASLGFWAGGTPGLIAGFALAPFVNYAQQVWYMRRLGVWFPASDLAALAISAAVLLLGWRLGL